MYMQEFLQASDEVDKEYYNDDVNCENVIEWIRNSPIVTVSFSQKRYISKLKKLAEKYPEDVQIVVENNDGSIVAHLPLKYIKISAPKKMSISDERRRELSDRFKAYHSSRRNSSVDDDEEDDDDDEEMDEV